MIGFLVAGLVIGVLARLIIPGRQRIGVLTTFLAGIIGSIVGGVIASALGTGSVWELNFVGFVSALGAAVLFVGTAEAIGIGSGGDRKRLNR